MAFKFYTSVAKGSEGLLTKGQKIFAANSYVCRTYNEKRGRARGPAVNKRQDQKQKINEAPKMLV